MKKRILVTTGTRAEYGFLRPLLKKIKKSKKLELLLVVTGTHLSKKHGNTIKEIKKGGLKISAKINMIPKKDDSFSMSVELGKGIIAFSKCFQKLKPDVNIILGDRDEMLASALAASHMNIVNAHIHGGDVSGGLDEYNRHAITKVSNIHFAATKQSKNRILRMGEDPKYVFFTGSTSIDDIKNNHISSKKYLEKKYNIKFKGDEILLIQHPVTTESELTEKQILNTLKAVIKTKKNIVAICPNSDAGHRRIFKQLKLFSKKYPHLKLYENLPRHDYLGMLKIVGLVVGNSSSGLIEASFFETAVVNIGTRQKNRERGSNVYDVSNESSDAIYRVINKGLKVRIKIRNKNIFGTGNASSKIVKVLERINLDKKLIQKQIMY